MTIPLQQGIVYGPIPSHRLGISLGINILPCGYKLCSFDCIYCQYGWTRAKTMNVSACSDDLPDPEAVYSELKSKLIWLKRTNIELNYITLSGNGEPTLHPELDKIIEIMRALRKRYYPKTKLAILSNSSTVTRPDVRAALNRLDERIMKLDAGSDRIIRLINRPDPFFSLSEVIEGLRLLKDVIVQAMFFTGPFDNTLPEIVADWIQAIREIKPKLVQLYTVYRPSANKTLHRVGRAELLDIAFRLQHATGVPAEVYD